VGRIVFTGQRSEPTDWARPRMARAIRRELEDDESSDLPHETVVAEMRARGMITPRSEARAAALTHEDFVRAHDWLSRIKRAIDDIARYRE